MWKLVFWCALHLSDLIILKYYRDIFMNLSTKTTKMLSTSQQTYKTLHFGKSEYKIYVKKDSATTAHRMKRKWCHRTDEEEECNDSDGEKGLREAGENQNKLTMHTAYSNQNKKSIQKSVSC
jgi:hypothetical protein